MPQFIQSALCCPPTGGVSEYVTGPGTWSWASAWAAGPLWLACGQPVVTYAATPGMPEVLGTWCAAACTVVVPVTPGGITSALVLPPRLTAHQAITPVVTAATPAIAPMVIRLRRRAARFCWARRAAIRSCRAACLPFFVLTFAFGTGLPSSLDAWPRSRYDWPAAERHGRRSPQPRPSGLLTVSLSRRAREPTAARRGGSGKVPSRRRRSGRSSRSWWWGGTGREAPGGRTRRPRPFPRRRRRR